MVLFFGSYIEVNSTFVLSQSNDQEMFMRLKTGILGLALCVPLLAWAGGTNQSSSSGTHRVQHMIIKYRDNPTGAVLSSRSQAMSVQGTRHGVAMTHFRTTALKSHVMRLDRKLELVQAQQLAREIMASDSTVEYAEPDLMMHAMMVPNDSRYNEQWQLFESTGGINVQTAWDNSTGSGIVVGVIDSGYRPHADLAANIVQGYDFISDTFVSQDGNGRDSDAQDVGDSMLAGECDIGDPSEDLPSSWHGTHTAGTVGAITNNGSGVAGVAFNAKVLPVRVLGKCGGLTSDIADAIVWASGGAVSGVPANANPARVLNISLGGISPCGSTFQNAINSARSRNTVVVVAAGNDAINAANASPANCSGVIPVAATTRAGGRTFYSNFGAVVKIAAPGGEMSGPGDPNGILSTLNTGLTLPGNDSYEFYQGTSMAAPHVAGVVALMLSKNPALTPDQVLALLQQTARPFPASCSQCGSGIVNAAAAVAAATAPPPAGVTINEVESNNSRGTSQPITNTDTTVNGAIGSSADTDYFSLSLPAGKTLTVTLTPNTSSDYDLYIYNSNGTEIARSTNGTGVVDNATVTNTGSSTFTRYVRVRYFSGGTGSTNGKYTLRMKW
jgi:serine protease